MDRTGRRREYISSFLNALQFFLVEYFALATIEYGVGKEAQVFWYLLLLLPAAVISFEVRNRTKYFWSFLLGHLSVFAYCMLLARNQREYIFFGIYGVTLYGMARYRREQRNRQRVEDNTSIALLLLTIPCLIYAYVSECKLLFQVFTWIGIIFLWIYIVNKYLVAQQRYLLGNTQTSGKTDVGKMYWDSSVAMILFSGVAAGLLGVGTLFSTGNIVEKLIKVIYGCLRFLFGFLQQEEPPKVVEEQMEQVVATSEPLLEMVQEETGPSLWSVIVNMLGMILVFVIKIVEIIVVLGVVALMCYLIWKSFYAKMVVKEDEVEHISLHREKRKKEKRKRSFQGIFREDTNRRVRKLFKKKIEMSVEGSGEMKKRNTATELAIKSGEEDVLAELVPLYQKARYSQNIVTKEEIETYKKGRSS